MPAPNYLGQMIVSRSCQNIEGLGYNYHYQTLNSNSLNALFNYQGVPISYSSIVKVMLKIFTAEEYIQHLALLLI
jgi:hypothetical protein